MFVKGKLEIIPMGLITRENQDPSLTKENTELKVDLQRAVEKAELNVTERMALNKQFYPNGGGFDLFSKNENTAKFNLFYVPGETTFDDSFTKEIRNLKLPEEICKTQERIMPSSKSNFQTNLDNALNKLKKVFKEDKEK